MQVDETPKFRCQPHRCKRHTRCNREHLPASRRGKAISRRVNKRECLTDCAIKDLTGIGQTQTTIDPGEKRLTKLVFESFDLSADSGLGERQFLRGMRET